MGHSGSYDAVLSFGWNGFDQDAFKISTFPHLKQSEKVDLLSINANGNVGIGTATPQEKLSVNGKIRAKEIKIEIANWPDYVFEKQYPLLSLSEIEKQIKEKGHLPEMPSVKYLETNGLVISEMINLQQKKIEELTLYLIEKDKAIRKYKFKF